MINFNMPAIMRLLRRGNRGARARRGGGAAPGLASPCISANARRAMARARGNPDGTVARRGEHADVGVGDLRTALSPEALRTRRRSLI